MNKSRKAHLPFPAKIFLAGIIAKQFYILPSGLPQIGDFLILFSYVALSVTGNKPKTQQEDISLRTFVILVALVNGVHFIFSPSRGFLMSTFYYLFNYIVVLCFKKMLPIAGFGKALERVLELNLLIQLFIYLTGRGEWYHVVRYMGTFNDPNQYAFFIFGDMLLICLIKNAYGDIKKMLPWYFLSFYLMMPASSTGMLLGFTVFFVFYIMFSLQASTGRVLGMLFFAILGVSAVILYMHGYIKLPVSFENSFMMRRLNSKLAGLSSDPVAMAEDRQWGKLIHYPGYILIGAGEGDFSRFRIGRASEIHSSILGPLWYYGIIPFSIWMKWSISKIKKVDRIVLCVYAALILESITLVNNRQPFFWMIYAMADFNPDIRANKEKRLKNKHENAVYT